jgi:hypothetical protein
MSTHRLSALSCALVLGACAHSSASTDAASPGSAQETSAMTSTTSVSPRLDAERSLSGLLALIRSLRSVRDIDADRLQRTFGVPFDAEADVLGFGERLTGDWSSSFEFDPADGGRFEFAFLPEPAGSYPSMSEICRIDFDRFAAELQAMGFRRETYRGEHNRVIHDRFERDGLIVTVHTRGEADDPPAKITHACVLRVLLN